MAWFTGTLVLALLPQDAAQVPRPTVIVGQIELPDDATASERTALIGRRIPIDRLREPSPHIHCGGVARSYWGVIDDSLQVEFRVPYAGRYEYTSPWLSGAEPAELEPFLIAAHERMRVHEGERIDVRILLDRGWRLRGRVVDEDGAPIRDASVYVSGTRFRFPSTHDFGYGHESSDERGEFTLRALPPKVESIDLHARGYETVSFTGAELEHALDPEGRLGVVMKAWPSIYGRVVDADGEPMSDVEVRYHRSWAVRGGAERKAKTNGEGRFEFDGVHPGPAELWVERRRFAGRSEALQGSLRVEPRTTDRDSPCEIRLGPPRPIRGRVIDPCSRSLENVRVYLPKSNEMSSDGTTPEPTRWPRPRTVGVDAVTGEFVWLDPGPRSAAIHARVEGEDRPRRSEVLRLDPGDLPDEVVLRLPATTNVAGRLEAPPELDLSVARIVAVKVDGSSHRKWQHLSLAAGAEFELTDLVVGRYEVRLYHPEWTLAEPVSFEIDSIESPTSSLRLVPIRGGHVTVRTEPDGDGHITAWRPKLLDPAGRWMSLAPTYWGLDDSETRFGPLPPGEYVVSREFPDDWRSMRRQWQMVDVRPGEDAVVTTHSEPPWNREISGRARDTEGRPIVDHVVEVLRGPLVVARFQTGLDGTFAARMQDPGRGTVVLRSNLSADPLAEVALDGEGRAPIDIDWTIPSVEGFDLGSSRD